MRTSRTRALLRFVFDAVECVAYLGAWWLFAGTSSIAEMVVGSVAVALAFTASHLVGVRLGAQFHGPPKAILQLWRVPSLVLTGTFDLMKVLAKDRSGRERAGSLLRAVRFVHTGPGASDQTFQALATAYTTISPNFVVVDVDPRAHVLLFHQLTPTPVPKLTQKLGASP